MEYNWLDDEAAAAAAANFVAGRSRGVKPFFRLVPPSDQLRSGHYLSRARAAQRRKPRYGLINDRPRPGQIMICQIEILAASKYLHAEISTEPAAPLYSSRPLARPMRDGQTRSPRKTMSLETQGSVHTYFRSPLLH